MSTCFAVNCEMTTIEYSGRPIAGGDCHFEGAGLCGCFDDVHRRELYVRQGLIVRSISVSIHFFRRWQAGNLPAPAKSFNQLHTRHHVLDVVVHGCLLIIQ